MALLHRRGMSGHKPSIKMVLLGEGDRISYLHSFCSLSFG